MYFFFNTEMNEEKKRVNCFPKTLLLQIYFVKMTISCVNQMNDTYIYLNHKWKILVL